MQDEEKRNLKAENQILRDNVKDLEKQLHDAYKRINELSQCRQ